MRLHIVLEVEIMTGWVKNNSSGNHLYQPLVIGNV